MIPEVPIIYRDFYDVPRVFLVFHRGQQLLFESVFDEERDDYSDVYDVYLLPPLGPEEIAGSWEFISKRAVRRVGRLLVSDVRFDSTRRKSVDPDVLDRLNLDGLP